MRVSMPRGRSHGWGIAGEYLAAEIAKLTPLPGVTLHCMKGLELVPFDSGDWDRINIGYCFFEDALSILQHCRKAAQRWDFIAAGSSWCEHILQIGGVVNTAVILQGVDSDLFYTGAKKSDTDRFVVFSGGKFELRKGQDLVIAAMKVFMERHADVLLSAAWYNQWPFSTATMELSPVIRYQHRDEDCLRLLADTLQTNGIPLDRVRLHPPLDNTALRQVYLDSDIGLFPNRCEGGNNMVLCEYMACGRPVIATDLTGHADVISPDHALVLESSRPLHYRHYAEGFWFEPTVEEIIEKLEYAYRHRSELRSLGLASLVKMSRLSWRGAAAGFHRIGASLLQQRSATAG